MIVALAALVAIGACGTARRGPPEGIPVTLDSPQERRGEPLFFRFCHKCHPNGEAGLGPALNNKALPEFVIKFQVRQGLGAMPAFSSDVISDDELDDIVEYMEELR